MAGNATAPGTIDDNRFIQQQGGHLVNTDGSDTWSRDFFWTDSIEFTVPATSNLARGYFRFNIELYTSNNFLLNAGLFQTYTLNSTTTQWFPELESNPNSTWSSFFLFVAPYSRTPVSDESGAQQATIARFVRGCQVKYFSSRNTNEGYRAPNQQVQMLEVTARMNVR